MRNFLTFPVLFLLLTLFAGMEMLGGPANWLDIVVIRHLMDFRAGAPALTKLSIFVTQFGSVYATVGLSMLAVIALAWKRSHGPALLLALTVLAERMVADGLKLVFVRPRPAFDIHAVVTNSYSFPSGHAANSMTAYLAIALIAVPRAYRRPAVVAACLLVLTIGVTRCFLGVHWPSDVIGGWSLGLMAIWVSFFAGERSGALRVEPQHDIVGRHRLPTGEDEPA